MTSFDQALEKGKVREHFQAVVENVRSLAPDVVVVGAPVDDVAKELFEVRRILLLLRVKGFELTNCQRFCW